MATWVERTVQRVVAFAARLAGRPVARDVDPASLARILVVRLDDRLGNVLLTTPLLRALREGLPDARVDWLLPAQGLAAVDGLGLAHELVAYDRRSLAWNPLRLGALAWRLRRNRYDAVVEASHPDRFSTTQAVLARLTGAPVRVGADRGHASSFYTHPVAADPSVTRDVPARLRLLAPLGVAARGGHPETLLGTRGEDAALARELLASAGLDGPFVVVSPGPAGADGAHEALAVAARAVGERTGARLLVCHGPGEEERARALAGRLEPTSKKGKAAVVAPGTTLPVLAALLRRATMVVAPDGGVAQLGVACEAPVLALFDGAEAARRGHDLPNFRALDATQPADPLAREARKLAGELLGPGARAA